MLFFANQSLWGAMGGQSPVEVSQDFLKTLCLNQLLERVPRLGTCKSVETVWNLREIIKYIFLMQRDSSRL